MSAGAAWSPASSSWACGWAHARGGLLAAATASPAARIPFAPSWERVTGVHIPCTTTETTMPRTPHDNSAEMKATAERRKALVAQRKTRLGELLQSTGADGVLDFDQIAGLLRDGLERLAHNPDLKEVWRQKGQEHFRRGRNGLRRPAGPGSLHDPGRTNGTGGNPGPDRAPAPARGAAPPPHGQLPFDPKA